MSCTSYAGVSGWPPAPGASRFLLLDEPTSSLDLRHQSLLLGVLRDFAADGGGVLLIPHDLNLAAAVADRIALMQRGRLVAHGTPDEVLTPHRISRVYDVPAQVQRDPLNGRLRVSAGV
jgi:iron complex transport system ATP-binding protein